MNRAVLNSPQDPLPADHVPDTPENHAVFNEFINLGSGMPERLQLQLPSEMVDNEWGLECVQHVGLHLDVSSDASAALVDEFVLDPPVLTEGRKWMLGELLSEWRENISQAELHNNPVGEVRKRLSLKKMTGKVEDLNARWGRLSTDATLEDEPATVDILKMLDKQAKKYSAVKAAEVGKARLAALVAGDVKVEEKKPPRKKEQRKPPKGAVKGMCWAFQEGKCNRGGGCRFSHDQSGGSSRHSCHSVTGVADSIDWTFLNGLVRGALRAGSAVNDVACDDSSLIGCGAACDADSGGSAGDKGVSVRASGATMSQTDWGFLDALMRAGVY